MLSLKIKNRLRNGDPFEKYLNIKDIDTVSFEEKTTLWKAMKNRIEIGSPAKNSIIKENQRLNKIFDNLISEVYEKETVDYEDYNLSRNLKSIHTPTKKDKKAPKLIQLHDYLSQSIWNDTTKEIDMLSHVQQKTLKAFVDKIVEYSTGERAIAHKENPDEALKNLKAGTNLEAKALKLKDFINISSLEEYLAKKLNQGNTTTKLFETLKERNN